MSKNYLSREGYEKLKQELYQLTKVERPAISQQIADARDKGDLSENAEYDAAKDAQGLLEMKISKLQQLFASSTILDESQIDTSKVSIFTTVRILNTKMNKEFTYTLVSEKEADLKQKKISARSAIGAALLGHTPGDIVSVQVPAGLMEFKVLEITA
jgi:transcription elongation factor GreA